ncbi:hypothetical protein GCM10020255_084710 [Rhodococcus baikonurensis]
MPGLDAKDVIDIQITVEHLGVADDLAEDLAAAGFPDRAHRRRRPETVVPRRRDRSSGVGKADSRQCRSRASREHPYSGGRLARSAVRDPLPRLASRRSVGACRYAELKVKAAESAAGIDDYASAIDAYLGVKTPWFDAAFHRAWEWAEKSGWSL